MSPHAVEGYKGFYEDVLKRDLSQVGGCAPSASITHTTHETADSQLLCAGHTSGRYFFSGRIGMVCTYLMFVFLGRGRTAEEKRTADLEVGIQYCV